MSRLHFLSLVALASSAFTIPVHSADSPSDNPVDRYQLKKRSSFAVRDNSRPPFWPIGHVKANRNAAAAPLAPVPTVKMVPEMFSVSSILLGNPSLAVINGRAYGEGEYLRPARNPVGVRQGAGASSRVVSRNVALDPRIRVRVIRIHDGNVTLQSSDGQSVDVPLRRGELSEPKPDLEAEMLLNNQ